MVSSLVMTRCTLTFVLYVLWKFYLGAGTVDRYVVQVSMPKIAVQRTLYLSDDTSLTLCVSMWCTFRSVNSAELLSKMKGNMEYVVSVSRTNFDIARIYLLRCVNTSFLVFRNFDSIHDAYYAFFLKNNTEPFQLSLDTLQNSIQAGLNLRRIAFDKIYLVCTFVCTCESLSKILSIPVFWLSESRYKRIAIALA